MNLHVAEFGSAPAPPLIILHGFLGSSDNWHTLARRFGDSHHVFAPDARNHGRSPHSEEFSYAVMADDLRDLLGSRGIASAAVLGHSMGGRAAMELAVRHPECIRALIIVDIAPRAYEPHHQEIFAALRSVDLAKATDRAAVDAILARRVSSAVVRQFLMKNLHRTEGGGFQWKMNLPVLEQRYREVLKGIPPDAVFDKPTLFIRGGRSDYIQEADMPLIRRQFPRGQIAAIDAGHWVHAEKPEEFFMTVSDFLSKSAV